MTKISYAEQLKDPRWQKVRLKKLEAADWKCQCCGDHERTLAVHHKRYIKGHKPWEYDLAELVVLCETCHEDQHEWKDLREELMARLDVDGPAGIDDFFAFGAGAVHSWLDDDATAVALLKKIKEAKPYQYCSGMFAGHLSVYGVSQRGMERLAELADPGAGSINFLGDLFNLLQKHGVELLGSPRREGEND